MQQNTETNNFRNKLTCATDRFFSMDSRRENGGNNATKNYRIFPFTIIFFIDVVVCCYFYCTAALSFERASIRIGRSGRAIR